MSNPVVKISDFAHSEGYDLEQDSWSIEIFSEQFHSGQKLYHDDESASGLDPTNFSPPFNMVYQINSVCPDQPDFVAKKTWENVYRRCPSVFVTANNSVMPKIIGANVKCVANGWKECEPASLNTVFNANYKWKLIDDESDVDYLQEASDCGVISTNSNDKDLFCCVNAVKDAKWDGHVQLKLTNDGISTDVSSMESVELIGAFTLALSITPVCCGKAGDDGDGGKESNYDPTKNEDPSWYLSLQFGDVVAELVNTSTLNVKILGGDEQTTTVNLASGESSENVPQTRDMSSPILLTFYKCWNGIIVSTGIQTTQEVVDSASTICTKFRDYSLSKYLEKNFDKSNPDDVQVSSNIDGDDYNVNFGDEIKLYFKNCRAQFAYIPACFCPDGKFDNWQVRNKDDKGQDGNESIASYEYYQYCIWADNNSGYSLKAGDGNGEATKTNYDDKHSGLQYCYTPYEFEAENFRRSAAEAFGYYLRVKMKDKSSIKNSNGSFSFSADGSGAQGDDGDWTDFITSVNVTQGIDGANGQIVVDGLGWKGSNAHPKQSVGGIEISVSGGNNTTGGTIFKGLAMGIGSNATSSTGELTVPLLGVEKKLQDMALINPPFMDGWTLSRACDFLFDYSGIAHVMDGADSSLKLSSSTEITKAIFDWKTGTTVEQALNDVMVNTHHTYAIIDGKAHIYKLGDDGLPTSLGSNRKGSYDDTNILQYSQEPNFDNLRNYCVAMGITMATGGAGTQIKNLAIRPSIVVKENRTTPNISWAKIWAKARPGYSYVEDDERGSENTLEEFAKNMMKSSKQFALFGKITVAGNADIKPYDKWGGYVIYSVSHSVDLQSKIWTTSLELQSVGDEDASAGGHGGGETKPKK